MSGDKDMLELAFQEPTLVQKLELIRQSNIKHGGNILNFVSVDADLSECMLDAIFKLLVATGGPQEQRRAVQMAVQWGHDSKATEFIDRFWESLDPVLAERALQIALQTALETRKVSFIKQIFARVGESIAIAVRNVDMCRLYSDPAGIDRFGVLSGSSAKQLRAKLRTFEGVSQKHDFIRDASNSLRAHGPYEKFREAAGDFLTLLCPPMRGMLYSEPVRTHESGPAFKVTSAPDLFFWAVLIGSEVK
jgi:hypothetical protein